EDLVVTPPGDGQPRLLDADGVDVTPTGEPDPHVAIDRLLQIHLRPGVRGSARVVLHGACVGTMADLASGASCVDTEGLLAVVGDVALGADMSHPGSSKRVGSFGKEVPCTETPRPAATDPGGAPVHDEEACVPGGLVLLGSAEAGELGDLVEE